MNKAKRHIMTDAEARAYIQGKPDEPTEDPKDSEEGDTVVGTFLGGMNCNTPVSSSLMQSVALSIGLLFIVRKRRKND